MKIITVEIDTEQDLEVVKAFLIDKGLKFEIEEEDWGDLPEEAIEGIKAGLADFEAGRTHSHEYVMAQMRDLVAGFRNENSK